MIAKEPRSYECPALFGYNLIGYIREGTNDNASDLLDLLDLFPKVPGFRQCVGLTHHI